MRQEQRSRLRRCTSVKVFPDSPACHNGRSARCERNYIALQAAPSTAASPAALHASNGSGANTATAAHHRVPQLKAGSAETAAATAGTVPQPFQHTSAHADQAGAIEKAPAPLHAAINGTPAAASDSGDHDGGSAAAAAPAAPDPVCPLCLGILQSLDAYVSLPAGGRAIALPETDAGGGTWHLAAGGAAAQLAQVVRCAVLCCGPSSLVPSAHSVQVCRRVGTVQQADHLTRCTGRRGTRRCSARWASPCRQQRSCGRRQRCTPSGQRSRMQNGWQIWHPSASASLTSSQRCGRRWRRSWAVPWAGR